MNNENIDFFNMLDIRVGKIVNAEVFEEARNPAYKLTIFFGDEIGFKKSSAQITNYEINDLIERKCIAVINLGNRQIGPFISECLVLGSLDSNNKVLLLDAATQAKPGDKIA
jgi:tRNA-binding protein